MNERACYRIGSDAGLDALALTLSLPDGRNVAARLRDTSARGLTIETRGDTVWLRPGVQMTVHIALPALSRSIDVPVIVRGVREPGRRFGVELCNPEQLERELPPELFRLFNRRQTPRTLIDAEEYIPFKLSSGNGRRAVGRMRDISVAGASLELPARDDPGFATGEPVQIALQMRNGKRNFDIAGHIRRVYATRRHVVYGVEFDAERCPTTQRHRRALEQLMSEITLVEQADPGARVVAERRAAKRARPSEELTLSIELRGKGERRARSQLRDISITGMGVIVPAAEDPEFAADEEMELTLELPHDSLDLTARIRRGLLIDSQVCYGLEFDPERSGDESCSALRTLVELLLLDDDSPTGKLIAQISGGSPQTT